MSNATPTQRTETIRIERNVKTGRDMFFLQVAGKWQRISEAIGNHMIVKQTVKSIVWGCAPTARGATLIKEWDFYGIESSQWAIRQ